MWFVLLEMGCHPMVIILLFALIRMLEVRMDENGICDILTVYTIQFILTNIAPMGDYSVILEITYVFVFISLRDDTFIG